jgi:hypothetical protein
MYKALISARKTADDELYCTFENMITGGVKVKLFATDKLTEKQLISWVNGDKLIQNAMPNLTAQERELFLNGDMLADIEDCDE